MYVQFLNKHDCFSEQPLSCPWNRLLSWLSRPTIRYSVWNANISRPCLTHVLDMSIPLADIWCVQHTTECHISPYLVTWPSEYSNYWRTSNRPQSFRAITLSSPFWDIFYAVCRVCLLTETVVRSIYLSVIRWKLFTCNTTIVFICSLKLKETVIS